MESTQNQTPFQASVDASPAPEIPVFDALVKEKHRRLLQRGQMWLCAGLVLMALSFAVNFLLFHSETSFSTIMYIMTSVGAACMVKGLVDILGF